MTTFSYVFNHNALSIWHLRLGHIDETKIKETILAFINLPLREMKKGHLRKMEIKWLKNDPFGCMYAHKGQST